MLRRAVPATVSASTVLKRACTLQSRGISIFDVFGKEAKERRANELKEELQRGYFDDFREFRDSHGKTFAAQVFNMDMAPAFPRIQATLPDGSQASLPLPPSLASVTMVAVAFRAGAQDLIESWAVPYADALSKGPPAPSAALVELALIESVVMRNWPFKGMLLGGAGESQKRYKLPATYLYDFAVEKQTLRALQLTNKLTGYVFLVDAHGRIRWRASGPATPEELETMLGVATALAAEARPGARGARR